jgi:hypothetical protein
MRSLPELARQCAAELTSDIDLRAMYAECVLGYLRQVDRECAEACAAKPPDKPKPAPVRPETDWQIRLIQCERILASITCLPDRAQDFGESVQEKVESIQAWIEDNERVSEAQQTALDNMESGIDRWLS